LDLYHSHINHASATVELMLAKVLVHRETDSRCFEEIFKTVELALRPFQTHRGTLSAYGTCDLSLILLLIQHVIHHLDFARGDENESRICSIIMRLISLYPSNNEASCLLSKVQLKLKDYEGFKATFDSSLKHSHEPALAKITKAQYYLLTGQIKAGLEILEEALSENFSIQNHPYFCFVKGSLLLEMVRNYVIANSHYESVR
jgi:tetratricopeptide (TPR) repeat protein